MGWTITIALNFAWLIVCDLITFALLVVAAAGLGGGAAKLGLRICFVGDLFFLLSILVLITHAVRSRGLMYQEWMIVCLCLSAILAGIAGYYTLRSMWRFAALIICLPGLVSLAMWYLKFRRMVM